MKKMQEITAQGRTVLLVSHNMASIQHLSNRVMLLDAGKIVAIGEPTKIVSEYLKRTHIAPAEATVDLRQHEGRADGSTPTLTRVRVLNAAGQEDSAVPVGGTIKFEITLDAGEQVHNNAWLIIAVMDANDVRVTTLRTLNQNTESLTLRGQQEYSCTWPDCNLAPGEYRLDIDVMASAIKGRKLDSISRAVAFEVTPSDFFGIGRAIHKGSGVIWVKAQWEFDLTALSLSPTQPL